MQTLNWTTVPTEEHHSQAYTPLKHGRTMTITGHQKNEFPSLTHENSQKTYDQ